jgi:hypothetical protein
VRLGLPQETYGFDSTFRIPMTFFVVRETVVSLLREGGRQPRWTVGF